MISAARFPYLSIRAAAARARSRLGGSCASHSMQLLALVMAAAMGCLISYDREAGVFGPSFIYKCGGAVRQCSKSHRGNCFHNVPQTLFLALESMNAPSIKCQKQRNKDGDARQSEPVSLIVGRSDVQSDRSFWPVPQPLAVAGDSPESVGAGPQAR